MPGTSAISETLTKSYSTNGIFKRIRSCIQRKLGFAQKEVLECKGKSLNEMAEMTSKKDTVAISKHKITCKKEPNGNFKIFDKNDNMVIAGNRQTGEYTKYDIEGNRIKIANTHTGEYTHFYKNGNPSKTGNLKTGEYTEYYENKKIATIGNTKTGEYKKLYEGGGEAEVGNAKTGEYIKYAEGEPYLDANTGKQLRKQGKIVEQRTAEGVTTVYNGKIVEKTTYPDGTVERFVHAKDKGNHYGDLYKKTMPDGSVEYYTVDTHQSLGSFDKNGYGTRYYQNGQIAEQKNSDGTYLYLFENGKVRAQKNNLGEIEIYDSTGELKFRQEATGFRKWYEPDGRLRKTVDSSNLETIYFGDGTVKKTQYDENGFYTYRISHEKLVWESPCMKRDDVYETVYEEGTACNPYFKDLPSMFD